MREERPAAAARHVSKVRFDANDKNTRLPKRKAESTEYRHMF